MKVHSSIPWLIALQCFAPGAWSEESPAQRDYWHKAPALSVMTGFIYEPKSPYTIHEWMENLGSGFDADQWVRDFAEIGASHLVFYDKWIDGLVFHDTKTTGFKTKRDFLREIAAACQRGKLPLVIYFNAISDGNPEFDPWSLLGHDGQPIVFGAAWPTRYQTLHSPFRAKCLEQVRELLTAYGPIHGIWHDIFDERLETTSAWTARGYQEMFGEPFANATPQRRLEFRARTLAGYLDEVEAIRREQNQRSCLFTSNGSGGAFFAGGFWRETVGARLQYFFNEGHSFSANEELARMAWALPKPLDINLLLNKSWFTPLEDRPPPSHLTAEQAIAATAIAVCQGAGVNLAMTPGHCGTFGEDLQRAKAVGAWFRGVRPWLEEAQPYTDVGIVPLQVSGAAAAGAGFCRAGVLCRWTRPDDDPLAGYRAVFVPAHSPLDDSQVRSLCSYVHGGGTLVTCGDPAALADLCGVRVIGDARFDASLQGAQAKVDSQDSQQYADVQAIRLLDGAGQNRALGSHQPVRIAACGAECDPLAGEPLTLSPSAVAVEPTTAEVLAIFANCDGSPAILSNRCGKGRALLVTTHATPAGNTAIWTWLRQLAVGAPTFRMSAEAAGRYRLILTRVGETHVLHAIDAEVTAADYTPQPLDVRLNLQRVHGVVRAALAGSQQPLDVLQQDEWLSLRICPDPVASVVLQ